MGFEVRTDWPDPGSRVTDAEFTAEEAFEQGKRDVQMGHEAIEWFEEKFGEMTLAQREEVMTLVLQLRYDAHIEAGELKPR